MMTTFENTLLSAEADAAWRSGYGSNDSGRVNAAIPKLRQGTYFPERLSSPSSPGLRRSILGGERAIQEAQKMPFDPDNTAPWMRVLSQCATTPERIAISDSRGSWSYAKLGDAIGSIRHALGGILGPRESTVVNPAAQTCRGGSRSHCGACLWSARLRA